MKKIFFIGYLWLIFQSSYAQQNDTPPFVIIKNFADTYNANGEYIGLQELNSFCFLPNENEQRNILRAFRQKTIFYQDYLFLANAFQKKIGYIERQGIFLDLKDFYKKYPLEDTDENFMNGIKEVIMDSTNQRVTDYPNKLPFPTIDFNEDKIADLIAIPSGYFGPSYGYRVYAMQEGNWKFLFGCGGDFCEVVKKEQEITLRYKTLTIDDSEAEVLHNITFKKNQNKVVYHKFYYANNVILPKAFLPKFSSIKLKSNIQLRNSPQIINLPLRDTINPPIYQNTVTLYGNVLAEYNKDTEGYLLAKQGKWYLVAINPDFLPKKESFWHGMEGYINEENGKYENKPPFQPYRIGWIEKKFIQ
jgi:hypothetical protein